MERGTLKKCVNNQEVYPLCETRRARGPREEIHRPRGKKALVSGGSQGRSGLIWRDGYGVRSMQFAVISSRVEHSKFIAMS